MGGVSAGRGSASERARWVARADVPGGRCDLEDPDDVLQLGPGQEGGQVVGQELADALGPAARCVRGDDDVRCCPQW